MLNYERLSDKISDKYKGQRMELPHVFDFDEVNVIRRDNSMDKASIIQTAFIRDIDKIVDCPFNNDMEIKHRYFHFVKTMIAHGTASRSTVAQIRLCE